MSESEQSPGVADALRSLTQAVGGLARALNHDLRDASSDAQARAFNQVSQQLQAAADTLTKQSEAAERRKHKRTATQEEILAATKRVVAAKGYAGASMSDIAAEANFTKGAIYGSFASKEELLLAAADRYYELQHDVLAEHATNGTAPVTWEEMCTAGDTTDVTFALETLLFAIRHPAGRAQSATHINAILQASARLCVEEKGQEPGPEHEALAFIISSVYSMAGLYSAILGPENVKDMFAHAARLLASLSDAPPDRDRVAPIGAPAGVAKAPPRTDPGGRGPGTIGAKSGGEIASSGVEGSNSTRHPRTRDRRHTSRR